GAAIEQTCPATICNRAERKTPQLAMDGSDLVIRRDAPAADGPDRLIGDNSISGRSSLRQAPHELRRHHVNRSSSLPLGFGLTNADNRDEAGPQRRRRLALDDCIDFPMTRAAFRMADD